MEEEIKLDPEEYLLLRTKINQIRMVNDRGFKKLNDKEKKLIELENSDAELIEYWKKTYATGSNIRANLNKHYVKNNSETDKVEHLYVYYAYDMEAGKTKDLGKKSVYGAKNNIKYKINDLISKYDITEDDISVIVVSPVEIKAEKKTKGLGEIKNLVVFKESELVINITEHKNNNGHIKIPDNEKEKLLKELGCSIDKLGMIRQNNIVAKWYGYKPGDIIMIKKDYTIPVMGQKVINYRHCA